MGATEIIVGILAVCLLAFLVIVFLPQRRANHFEEIWIELRKIFSKAGIAQSEIEDVMQWALGTGWQLVDLKNFSGEWNKRHCDIFVLWSTDNFFIAMERVCEAYLEYKRKEAVK